jgi:hypothetical protein
LLIPAGAVNDDLRLVVEAIDRVHGVGRLPRIPMEFRNHLGMHGRFDFDETTGEPIRIVIDRRAPYRAFVAIHEIGHFLDLAAFGDGPIFGSVSNPILSSWSRAVEESAAHQQLVTLFNEEPSTRLLDRLRADELWSRSYSQYVAVLSGSEVLSQSLTGERLRAPMGLHNPLYWEDNDFARIAEAIDALFAGLGWRQ